MDVALELDEKRFVSILSDFIGEVESLQNNPAQGLVPEEERIVDHILKYLGPHTTEQGGPLVVQKVSYVEKRANLIVEYPSTSGSEKVVSFVGSHMDVVPANPEDWSVNPFTLTVDKDDNNKLFGRGVTDCLGHVAMLTELMIQLAEKKPSLSQSVVVVFIANEENSEIEGVGVDEMERHGLLEKLKNGPLYWIDTADKQPSIGTGAVCAWKLDIKGKKGHSGLPQNAINSLMLGFDSVYEMMRRFHEDFPAHEQEAVYNYGCPSTLKPTMVSHPPGSVNQIPGDASIQGDIRLTPFYSLEEAKAKVTSYVDDINADLSILHNHHPIAFNNELEDGSKGVLTLEWEGDGYKGIACNLQSSGYKAIAKATEEVLGEIKPMSLTGSLPLVGDLQESGFDVQLAGYGVAKVYHGIDEYGLVSDFKDGIKILGRTIQLLEDM